MTNVLVCIKRVPDTGGEIKLTPDSMSVDTSYVGHTVSPHEDCAVELAIQTARATDGEATVLSLGSADSLEQIRDALAVGCTGAVLIETEAERFGPADVARAIADVVQAHEQDGRTYDLVLLGNDAADTGDFQVGIRLAYALDRPVVAGVSTVSVEGDRAVARVDGAADGTDIFEVELPAVLTVMEGGIEPRYPSVPGRMKAKRVTVETVTPASEPAGPGRVRLKLPPAQPSQVEIVGEGPEAAPAVVDLFERLGVLR
jgi:electron transfer flavoprotein beta subunit